MSQSLDVLYEDNHLLIVNKRPNELSQGDQTGDLSLLDVAKAYIKKKYNKPGDVFLGLVHRLDRPVSGVIIFSRTSKSLARMNQLIRDREIKKTYWAVTQERPPAEKGRLVHYMKKSSTKNKSFAHEKEVKDSKEAVLDYELVAGSVSYNLLKIDLKTGRHHQIRAQLAKLGCPIKGDRKYGAPRSNKDASIHLHARYIEFIHPVTKEPLKITAPPPRDQIWDFFVEAVG